MKRQRTGTWASSLAAGTLVTFLLTGLYLTTTTAGLSAASCPELLPNPNAYDDYLAAARLSWTPSNLYAGGISHDPALLRRVEASNQPAFQRLRTGFRHPFRYPPAATNLNYGPFRELARLLAAAGLAEEQRGDGRAAVRYYLDAYRLGAEVPRGGGLTGGLTGIAIDKLALGRLEAAVEHLDADSAAWAARELHRLEANAPGCAEALISERDRESTLLTAALRRTRSLTACMSMFQPTATLTPDAVWPGLRLYLTPRQWVLSDFRRYMNALAVQARTPYYQPSALPSVPSDPLNQMLLPVFSQARAAWASHKAIERVVEARLAVRAYMLRHGTPPSSLQALAPEFLPEVPADPFRAAPLVYRVKAGQPLLYSVGPDGVDDGGRDLGNSVDPGVRGDVLTTGSRH